MDLLYVIIFVTAIGKGPLHVAMADGPSFNNKDGCEVALVKKLHDAKANELLSDSGFRFGGACVLIEGSK